MPRRARPIVGGLVYHVLNRANARLPLFEKRGDYEAFERVLEQAQQREPLRILGYCVMPNHWHLVVWPKRGRDRQVSEFMRWLTVTHTQRWHAHRHSAGSGHLCQGRFKSFPIQSDEHLLTVLRYVERNVQRAKLVKRAEERPWSSLYRRVGGDAQARSLLSEWPIPRPRQWLRWVNEPQTESELESIRRSLQRGSPYGASDWSRRRIEQLGLEHTIRSPGRPRKEA